MSQPDTRAADRIGRLSRAATIAAKLRPLLDPDVRSVFAAVERTAIETMIAADTDEKRATAAAEIKAWRKLMETITALVADGPRAKKKLEDLMQAQTERTDHA